MCNSEHICALCLEGALFLVGTLCANNLEQLIGKIDDSAPPNNDANLTPAQTAQEQNCFFFLTVEKCKENKSCISDISH